MHIQVFRNRTHVKVESSEDMAVTWENRTGRALEVRSFKFVWDRETGEYLGGVFTYRLRQRLRVSPLDDLLRWFVKAVLNTYTAVRMILAPKGTMFWSHEVSADDWFDPAYL